MLFRVLIIQTAIIFCFGAEPTQKNELNNQNKAVDNFEMENFLNKKVPVPNIPYGPGSVHGIALEETVEKTKKERQLDELLKKIYSNFVENGKDDQQDAVIVVRPPQPTAKPTVNFKELENAVDELIKTLSLKHGDDVDTVKNDKKVHKQNVVNKVSYHDVGSENKIETDKKEDKLTFEQFKKKFKETFVNTNDAQIIPFKGKKKDKKNPNDKLRNIYDDLKHEVQAEESEKAKKVLMKKNKPDVRKRMLERKKKELVSLLNEVLGKDEFSYDGKVVRSKEIDQDFERLYQKKSVERVFLDKFKEGLDTPISSRSETGSKADVDEAGKQIDNKEKRIIETVRDFVKNHPSQQKDVQAEKKERLRGYLVDIVKLLKKDAAGNPKDVPVEKHVADPKQYESELEQVASKNDPPSSQTESNIEEILKGFDIEKRDVKLPHDRP